MPLTGLSWSMFFFAVGGTLALSFGFLSTMLARAVTTVIGLAGLLTVPTLATKYSLDLDLLTRGSGYGFLGSAVTSVIYALNWLMYAGLEAAFMASALHTQWSGVPLWVWYVVTSLITIPFNWYGVTQNDFVQRVTFPLFLAGLVWLTWKVVGRPVHPSFTSPGITAGNFFGALGALLPNVVIQVLGTCDFARFLRRRDMRKGLALGSVAVIWLVYVVSMPLGAVLALYTNSDNPGVYAASVIGAAGAIWIVVTQVRINNINFYSGSLALANSAARLLRFVPGRRFWILVTGAVTVAATELGIVNHLLQVVTILGMFLLGWAATLLADMLVLKPVYKLEPAHVEHRRGYLADWGVPSLVSLAVACAVGAVLNLGNIPDATFGPFVADSAALAIGFFGPIVAYRVWPDRWARLARTPEPGWADDLTRTDEEMEAPENVLPCGVCGTVTMRQDLLTCPVTPGNVICSVCCSAHSTCHDVCKRDETKFHMDEAEIRRQVGAGGNGRAAYDRAPSEVKPL
jgi:purine-cytosine permease-like protein